MTGTVRLLLVGALFSACSSGSVIVVDVGPPQRQASPYETDVPTSATPASGAARTST